VDEADADRISAEIAGSVLRAGHPEPDIFRVHPSGGARRDELT
jgi:hypothetical protein